jgi:hypothetical protein
MTYDRKPFVWKDRLVKGLVEVTIETAKTKDLKINGKNF